MALCVQYDGAPYCGWQAQPQLPHLQTVQGELQRALSRVADHPIVVHCAGRTDTGVHGVAQWVHFDLPVARSVKACVVGVNSRLPPSIRVVDAKPVAKNFHARHSALARSYDYLIANTAVAPALLADRVVCIRDPLDAGRMEESLQPLFGEQDFSAFRASSCQSSTPMRCLSEARVVRRGDYVQVRVTANAFLHHMVRNIVGSLLEVGTGERAASWLGELLNGRDRTRSGATAPAHGLYLSRVHYPEQHGLPLMPLPLFLEEPSRD